MNLITFLLAICLSLHSLGVSAKYDGTVLTDADLKALVYSLNINLPRMIDKVTRAEKISFVDEKTMQYEFTIINAKSYEINGYDFSNGIWPKLNDTFCNYKMYSILNKGITINVIYKGIDGKRISLNQFTYMSCVNGVNFDKLVKSNPKEELTMRLEQKKQYEKDIKLYTGTISKTVNSKLIYAKESDEAKLLNRIKVEIIVDSYGNLVASQLLHSSGYKRFDNEVLNAFNISSPFNPPPQNIYKLMTTLLIVPITIK